jgi:LppP/LprE lipoprotein
MVPSAAQTHGGDWLDSKSQGWNKAGGTLPVQPQQNWDATYPNCKSSYHPPNGAEEEAVAGAGWLVSGSKRGGDAAVVIGAHGLDGMCRPNEFQAFVFVKGKFAGTLSPHLMYARSDGSMGAITFPQTEKIVVEFSRYTDKDALCCPSRISEATFQISNTSKGPVVNIIGIRTRPSGA